MIGLGQPMFDPVFPTDAIERMAAKPGGRTSSVLRQVGELDAGVGEHNLDPVGHGGDKGLQDGARGLRSGLVDELSDRELGGAVDGDEEIELALRGLHFGDVDVEEADRIGLELPPRLFVAFHLRQSADAVALQTAMQRRAR